MAASESQIAEIERRFGVRLPDDYRRFLLTRGSMSEFLTPANSYVQIGHIDDVIPVNEAGDIETFPWCIVIGSDGSREILAYDFRQGQSPLVLLDITAEDWSDAVYQASSLTTLLAHLRPPCTIASHGGLSPDSFRVDRIPLTVKEGQQ